MDCSTHGQKVNKMEIKLNSHRCGKFLRNLPRLKKYVF